MPRSRAATVALPAAWRTRSTVRSAGLPRPTSSRRLAPSLPPVGIIMVWLSLPAKSPDLSTSETRPPRALSTACASALSLVSPSNRAIAISSPFSAAGAPVLMVSFIETPQILSTALSIPLV
ncbi:hypothetical protein D3C87_1658770 [compost metagenome]